MSIPISPAAPSSFKPLREGRIALALQFCPLDFDAAMRNAIRIADNEPKARDDIEFVFVERFDTKVDKEVIEIVSRKFRTSVHHSTRRGTGHPAGCNDLWCDWAVCGSLGKFYSGAWADVKFMMTLEADTIPVHVDWISKLSDEWAKATAAGKFVVGCWMDVGIPNLGHINGNMLVPPNIGQLFPNLVGCPPYTAWDMFFAPTFAPYWYKTGTIANFYRHTNMTEADAERTWCGSEVPPVVIHGVKDSSAEEYADQRLRKCRGYR